MTKKADAPEGATTEEETPKTPGQLKAAHMRKYRARYVKTGGVAGGTSASLDNDDPTARALRGATPEAVMKAAEILTGLEPGTLATRYAERNNGAKRMNAGNIIRGALKRGDTTAEAIAKALV